MKKLLILLPILFLLAADGSPNYSFTVGVPDEVYEVLTNKMRRLTLLIEGIPDTEENMAKVVLFSVGDESPEAYDMYQSWWKKTCKASNTNKIYYLYDTDEFHTHTDYTDSKIDQYKAYATNAGILWVKMNVKDAMESVGFIYVED